MSPASWTHLPPRARASALGSQNHRANSHWLSILHMLMYVFKCYFLKLSHPLLLPLSPKVCPLHLCLLCCPACRITGAIFLDSIYALIYDICLCLSYLLHSNIISIQYNIVIISPFHCWVCPAVNSKIPMLPKLRADSTHLWLSHTFWYCPGP